jgi:DNA-binding PadR family transcriptional regulator
MSLKFGVLGLLAEEPLHGYEVRSRFEAMLGGSWEVNIGQVYATLQRLERDGLVRAAGERGDRGKLAYEISEQGRATLGAWLTQPVEGPQQLREDFSLKLLLANRLADGDLRPLLAQQKRGYLQRMRDLNRLEARAQRDGRRDLARLVRGALLHAEADLKWIDELMEEAAGKEPGRR